MNKVYKIAGSVLCLCAICIANLGSALLGGEVELPEYLK